MTDRRLSLQEFQERVLGAAPVDAPSTPQSAFESVVSVHDAEELDIPRVPPMRNDHGRVIAFLILVGFIGGALQVLCTWLIDMLLRLRGTAMNQTNADVAFVLWTLYTLAFLNSAVLWTRLAPSAAGSGIAQMKTVLTGIDPTLYLPGYFSPRALVAKIGGLVLANGAGLQIGSEGAFVHIMAIIAHMLLQVRHFAPLQDRLSVRLQLLAASAAVAVSSAFGSPIGGVLFSIEVTATYYLISNYLKAFVSAVAAAMMAVWTNELLAHGDGMLDVIARNAALAPATPKSLWEVPLAMVLGALMGVMGAIALSATQWLAHRRQLWASSELASTRLFLRWGDPMLVALLTATATFFVTRQGLLVSLPDLLSEAPVEAPWALVLSGAIPLVLLPLSITLKFPTGVWLPTFVGGAAFGRLFGAAVSALFPSLPLDTRGFALVGAAALTGASTRTVSAAVIALEITGSLRHVLPVLSGVLVSIGTASLSGQPSMYDILVEANDLPYLPLMEFHRHQTVADILRDQVVYVSASTSVLRVLLALNRLPNHEIPVVASEGNRKLLGVVSKDDLMDLVRRFYARHGLNSCERDWGDEAGDDKASLWSTRFTARTTPTLDHIYTTLHRRPSSSTSLRGDGLYPVHPAMLMNDDKMTELLSRDWSPSKKALLQEVVALGSDYMIRPLAMTLSAETTLEDVHMLFTMLRMDHCYVTDVGQLRGVITTRSLIKAAAR
ncbi:Chloride Channel (ClC) Family [Achlya hypogyna]|uniref:Chloride channel protein n=1 Tax=Achlya hypogyna TaxID=1202772 RepID=A0A1V9Z4U2_ACHHY|nr:Chloride Channel (ClC) Family [Achlya hypogyna]